MYIPKRNRMTWWSQINICFVISVTQWGSVNYSDNFRIDRPITRLRLGTSLLPGCSGQFIEDSTKCFIEEICSGQAMLYENQSKGNNSKTEQGRVTVLMLCTLSHCQQHAYEVLSHLNQWWQSYVPDKKMLYKNQSKENNSKTEQGRVTVLVHCTLASHC